MNTLTISYIEQTIFILSTFLLLGVSIKAKTRETLMGVIWASIITAVSIIALFTSYIILEPPLGFEVFLFVIGGIVAAVVLLATTIICVVKHRKREKQENEKLPNWLHLYLVPIILFFVVFAMDFAAVRNADIIIAETSGWLEPIYQYAVSENRCVKIGIDDEFSGLTKTYYPNYIDLQFDYSTSTHPNNAWTLYIDEDTTLEERQAALKDCNAISTLFAQKKLQEWNGIDGEVTIYDLARTGYYMVEIYSYSYNLSICEEYIFHKDKIVTKVDIGEIKSIRYAP